MLSLTAGISPPKEEFEIWQKEMRVRLGELAGLPRMEECDPDPKVIECMETEEGFLREKLLRQSCPNSWSL